MSAAQAKKAEGNAHFKNKEYKEAIAKYTEAIALNPHDVTFYSNRSACYAALEKWDKALEDGKQCIVTDKKFVKGYFRAALGHKNLGDLESASTEVKRGLGIDSTSKDLKSMSKDIDELIRVKKVGQFIVTAQELIDSKDYAGATKIIDQAKRLDPENVKLQKLEDVARPRWESQEKERKANLDPTERIKEQGDVLFKQANFEAAITKYTEALKAIKNKEGELALKCYNNRAACYKQLSNFENTIEDCTNVLLVREDDVKALVRRAQAYEAVEKYKSALQDVKQVLSFGQQKVGKSSYDLANGMQHRLNRVIQQLKASQ